MAKQIISDNLTAQQRQQLYSPEAYQVRELAEGQWLALHTEVPAALSVARTGRGEVRVISNTLNEHTVTFAGNAYHCTCKDHEHHSERNCKHTSAARAVAHFLQCRRQLADAKQIAASIQADDEMRIRTERARRAVAGQIAERTGARRIAA